MDPRVAPLTVLGILTPTYQAGDLDALNSRLSLRGGTCRVTNANLAVRYTPSLGSGFSGQDQCRYRACDARGTCRAAFVTINVNTPKPTSSPTSSPTSQSPTQTPSTSDVPSSYPTSNPSTSTSPTYQPSLEPTNSKLPSVVPSISFSPTSDVQYTGMKITLNGIRSIEDVSDWEEATARYYERVYNNKNAVDSGLDNAVVEIMLTNINTKSNRSRQRERRGLLERILQQSSTSNNVAVVVTYSQSITYRNIDPSARINTILKMPLSTEEYRNDYVTELKQDLEGYDDLASVSSISTPYDGSADQAVGADESTDNDAGISTGGLIGIVVGGIVALALVVGTFVYYKKKNGRQTTSATRTTDDNGHGSTLIQGNTVNIMMVKDLADVAASATSAGLGPAVFGDVSVASEDNNNKYYAPPLGIVEDGGKYRAELLTIIAPKGKLGIVIDSPDNGPPVVHSLKETSPIVDKMQVGDRIVAIDDEDVRTMSSIKVSKLISKKSSNEERKFTVVRYIPTYHVMDEGAEVE